MKKIGRKSLALTTSALLLLGGMFSACSSDSDDGDDVQQNSGVVDVPGTGGLENQDGFTSSTSTVSKDDLGAEAESAKSGDESVATAEVSEGSVKITSVAEGTTIVTVSKSGYADAVVSVTVGADGSVSASVSEKFSEIPANAVLSSIEVPESVEIEECSTEDDLKAKLTVSAVYDNGAKTSVSEYTLSEFDPSKVGEEQTVTVTYNEKTATVKVTVKALFRSLNFDDAFDGTTEKDYANESADYVSADGTWAILHGVAKSAAKVSKNAAKSYNEDESYASRIQMKLEVLKLKVGKNKPVILRVDGGSASGTGSDRTLTAKGSTTDSWTSFKGSADGKVCSGFLSVTADENGYVKLSADNNINIYGIKIVDSKEDLSDVLLGNSVKYENAKVTLSATEVNKDESITFSASVDEVTTPLYANGLAGESSSKALTTFNFYVDPDGEGDEPVETLPTSEIGEHEIEAYLYTESDEEGVPTKVENEDVWAKATYTVLDPNVVRYTVTFDAGDGSFAEGATTTFTVEENKTLDSNSIPKPTAPDGKRFLAWTSSVDGLTTTSEITGDVTFTATYEDYTAQTYTFTVSSATTAEANAETKISVDGLDFYVNCSKAVPSSQSIKDVTGKVNVINMGGAVKTTQNYVKMKLTEGATVTVKYANSSADRYCAILDSNGKTVATTESNKTTADKALITGTMTVDADGTYYLGSASSGIWITEISVTQ